MWETIESFERDYHILLADISGFGTVAHLKRGIDRLLDSNGVGRVVLLGQSLADVIAQVYHPPACPLATHVRLSASNSSLLSTTLGPGRGPRVNTTETYPRSSVLVS